MKISIRTQCLLGRGKKCNRFAAGFTLMELMIVCAIVSIIATVGGFAITSPQYKLKGDARTLASNFMLARMKATSSGVQYAIQFDLDTPKGYNLQRGNASTASSSWTTVSYHREMSSGVNIVSVEDDATTHSTGSTARIICNPNGSSGTGEVVLKSGDDQYRITLTPTTGRVKTTKESL